MENNLIINHGIGSHKTKHVVKYVHIAYLVIWVVYLFNLYVDISIQQTLLDIRGTSHLHKTALYALQKRHKSLHNLRL